VVDVETATSDTASICQIGIVQFMDGRCVDRWSSLVNPGVAFDAFNIELHGITDEAVRGAPRLPELLPDLRRRFAGQIVGCHTMFDRNAFGAACRRHDEPRLDVRWLDTAAVVRGTWTQFSRSGYKLDNIADHLGITFQHHDALEDAYAAGQVLLRAIEKTGIGVEEWYARAG
jgi:DNA polymerase-3 subunit epsilon